MTGSCYIRSKTGVEDQVIDLSSDSRPSAFSRLPLNTLTAPKQGPTHHVHVSTSRVTQSQDIINRSSSPTIPCIRFSINTYLEQLARLPVLHQQYTDKGRRITLQKTENNLGIKKKRL